ncbi:MAG TPA: hypothetical protein VIX63_17250 [Vicinamibacterales bacterium]
MEHRKSPRRVPLDEEPISRVRLRIGREMTVVDVSNSGVLLEGDVRLLPGTHVDAHVVTPAGRLLIRSRIVRCWVAALQPDVVLYRGALAFERQVDTAAAGYAFPGGAHGSSGAQGRDYPLAAAGALSPGAEALVA